MYDTQLISNSVLFEVKSFHEYYQDAQGNHIDHRPYLQFEPTPECRDILKNHHLLFKRRPGGFTLFTRTLGNQPNLFVPFEPNAKLTFGIQLLHPLLFNFSQLPIESSGGSNVFYVFSNANSNLVGQQRYLSQKIGEAVSDRDQLSLYPKRFSTTIDLSATVSNAPVTVHNQRGDLVFATTVPRATSIQENNCNVDISNSADGIYTFTVAGQPTTAYFSDYCIAQSLFGILEIHTGQNVPVDYRFVSASGVIHSKVYILPFAARHCFWKYKLVERNHQLAPSDTVAIETSNASSVVSFQRHPQTQQYTSVQPIQLRCENNHCIATFPNASQLDTLEFPQPSYKNLKKDANDNLYVERFVYI